MDDAGRQRKRRRERGTYLTPKETITNLATMNKEAILGIVRHILTTAGGVLVTNGTLTSEQLQSAGGAAVVLIGIIWSVIAKKKAA